MRNGEDNMHDVAKDIVDELWADLQDRSMTEGIDPNDQLEILISWYAIVEGMLDGHDYAPPPRLRAYL